MANVPNVASVPSSISGYLDALKLCLKGQPPGLIQDALADAEEYLRAEQADTPEESEPQLLARIVETYGAPQEVARPKQHLQPLRAKRRGARDTERTWEGEGAV